MKIKKIQLTGIIKLKRLYQKDLKLDHLFFKKYFKTIICKYSRTIHRSLDNLYEVQNFEVEQGSPIWISKTSLDGKYLATGGKSGKLRIFEFIQNEGVQIDIKSSLIPSNNRKEINNSRNDYQNTNYSFMKLVNDIPFRIYSEHVSDIIDICWGISSKMNILLSASLDFNVIVWDVNKENYQAKFEHSSMVTSISFCPNNDEVFVSGCLDKIIRIWHIQRKKVIDYINTQDLITAITYSPTGNNIVVGFHNGKCSNFEVNPVLKYNSSFECKNKFGKYSKGTKITGLEFINKNEVLITSCDSRIRLININDNKLLQKYKGLKNEEIMIRSYFEENNGLIVCASDDGYVYVWRKYINMVPSVNQSFNPFSNQHLKNNGYEYFRPFEKDLPTNSYFVNEYVLHTYQKKFFLNKILIKNVILTTSQNGRISILIDPIFLDENDTKI